MKRANTTSSWRVWVDESINNDKGKAEFYNALKWMDENWKFVITIQDSDYYHPGIVFSNVLDSVIKNYHRSADFKEMLLKIIMDDFKCPFGMILKNKALKAVRRNRKLLNQSDVDNLIKLSNKLNSIPYKPRELIELKKTIKAAQQMNTSEPASPVG
jgi:hypothetical protein